MLTHRAKTVIFLILGHICIICAVIGALLPIVPTTPFLILAAFFYSKGSKKMHLWILNLPTFGPIVREWEESRIIRPKAKAASIFTIVIIFLSTLLFVQVHMIVKIILILIACTLIVFILTRNSGNTVSKSQNSE